MDDCTPKQSRESEIKITVSFTNHSKTNPWTTLQLFLLLFLGYSFHSYLAAWLRCLILPYSFETVKGLWRLKYALLGWMRHSWLIQIFCMEVNVKHEHNISERFWVENLLISHWEGSKCRKHSRAKIAVFIDSLPSRRECNNRSVEDGENQTERENLCTCVGLSRYTW